MAEASAPFKANRCVFNLLLRQHFRNKTQVPGGGGRPFVVPFPEVFSGPPWVEWWCRVGFLVWCDRGWGKVARRGVGAGCPDPSHVGVALHLILQCQGQERSVQDRNRDLVLSAYSSLGL